MKLLVMSDVHGSLAGLERALEKFGEERTDYILSLGDLLYHGPRNPLPESYNPKEVAARLNAYKDKIMTVRGNCDAEVDQMLIEFPVLADYAVLFLDGRRIFATHGHHHHMEHLPHLSPGDIFIQGHTHIPVAERRGEIYVLNPGSVSLPKGNDAASYGVLDEKGFTVKDFAGKVLKEIAFEGH